MKHSKIKRVMAIIGVIAILSLFILTIIFLLLGKSALAITAIATNGFVTIILFFLIKFHHISVEDNAEMIEASKKYEE